METNFMRYHINSKCCNGCNNANICKLYDFITNKLTSVDILQSDIDPETDDEFKKLFQDTINVDLRCKCKSSSNYTLNSGVTIAPFNNTITNTKDEDVKHTKDFHYSSLNNPLILE